MQIDDNTLPLAHAQPHARLQLGKLLSALTVLDVGQQRGNAGRIPATETRRERSAAQGINELLSGFRAALRHGLREPADM